MAEGGKIFAALTMLKTLEQHFWIHQSQIDVELFSVNESVENIPWSDFSEIGSDPRGGFSLQAFLDTESSKSADHLLIISDCCWSSSDKRAFRRLGVTKSKTFARALVVGQEADIGCRSPEFEPAENLLALLDEWIPC